MFNNRRKSEISALTFFFSFLEVKLTNNTIRYLKWTFRWSDIQVPCENSTDKFNSSYLGVVGRWVFIFLRYLPLCLCVWTFMLFCSGKFRLYSTVSSAIVTILYIRSSNFILQLKVCILYTNLSLFHPTPLPLSPWKVFPQPVQFSHSGVSDSLRPHESQHARPLCPSPTPGVYSNSCPSSRWCHPAISSSVVPFSSCPQSLPASGSFPMSQVFAGGSQSTGISASISVLPMNTQDWSPLGWTAWISLQSKGLSRVFSNTTVQ